MIFLVPHLSIDSYCSKSDRDYFDEPCGHTRQVFLIIVSLNIYWLQLKLFSLSVAGLAWLKEDKGIFAYFNITPLTPWRQKTLCWFKTRWFVGSLWDWTLSSHIKTVWGCERDEEGDQGAPSLIPEWGVCTPSLSTREDTGNSDPLPPFRTTHSTFIWQVNIHQWLVALPSLFPTRLKFNRCEWVGEPQISLIFREMGRKGQRPFH